MSSGNRVKRSSLLEGLFVLAALLLSGTIFCSVSYMRGLEAGRDQSATRKHYQSERNRAVHACINAQKAASIECVTKAVESAQEEAYAQKDLNVQREMSLWAFWMLVVSSITFIATVVGVYFVKRTLDATLQAVADTGAATAAMVEANKLADKDFAANHRPKIIIRGITEVFAHEDRVELAARFTNAGGTETTIFSQKWSILTTDTPPTGVDKLTFDPEPEERSELVAAGETYLRRFTVSLDKNEWVKATHGHITLYVWGVIWHRDRNGVRRMTAIWRKFERRSQSFRVVDGREEYDYAD
ncbi:hypothetical protein [Asticcacaulis sp. AND118]|uniref:hypothetical protein n=1 Tax=Asticcacaulis sp. AND118 TaxID=2840468 RepID=UPI001CFF7C43|nr:hypothetical protein [Asticcacaulis sp. AND118]UDF03493.1 hypothetical protein LH365_00185 [Asticcacaulis sp. AND118]